MRHERIEKDGGAIIREFLGEIKDYDKLIIDIRNNPGEAISIGKKTL